MKGTCFFILLAICFKIWTFQSSFHTDWRCKNLSRSPTNQDICVNSDIDNWPCRWTHHYITPEVDDIRHNSNSSKGWIKAFWIIAPFLFCLHRSCERKSLIRIINTNSVVIIINDVTGSSKWITDTTSISGSIPITI